MKKLMMLLIILIAFSVAANAQSFGVEEIVEESKPIPIPTKSHFYYKNMTKLVIQPEYKYLRLKAGETKTFEVKIRNPTEKDVEINAKVAGNPYETNLIDERWISFDKNNFKLNAKSEASIKITVSIPKNAEKGYYHGYIAFTNDSISNQYGIVKYINALSLSVEVWIPPSVKIYPRWISGKVEAGKTFEYEINLINNGEKTFTINPKLSEENNFYDPYGYTKAITKDMIKIEAPSTISPKSRAKVKIKIDVPSNAKGILRGSIDLGINDPGLDKWQQRVDINLRVYEMPKEPFVKAVRIENASKLTVKVSVNNYPTMYYPILYGMKAEGASGDVKVKIFSPSGEVNVRPKILENLFVTVGFGNPPWEEVSGIYKVTSVGKTVTYTINNPENGIWRIEVMPENNCESFNLQIEIE